MAVYLVQAGERGPIKIGYANDVPARLRELAPGNPNKLALLRVVAGDRSTETWFHRRFRAHRISREWFTLNPDMLACDSPPPAERHCGSVRALLARFGSLLKLQAALGPGAPSQQALSSWQVNNRIPSNWLPVLLRAAKAEGVELTAAELVDAPTVVDEPAAEPAEERAVAS